MQSKSQYVVAGVVGIAIIVAVVLGHGFQWLWATNGWYDPSLLTRDFTLSRAIGYGIAAAAAAGVLFHKPTFQLALEVVDELSKVTYPTKEETGNATIVVIVAVLISAAFLGVFDAVWLWLTNWILGISEVPKG